MATSWGIAGVGKNAHNFVTAINTLSNSNDDNAITAVAARKPEFANTFVSKNDLDATKVKTHGTFQDLSKAKNVDAVYVCVHPGARFRVSMAMLAEGKNVLCEAPMAMSQKKMSVLVNLAKEKKVLLMEADWQKHLPTQVKLRRLIKKGRIGEPKMITMTSGRENKKQTPKLSEMTSRCVALALDVFGGGEKPAKIAVTKIGSGGASVTMTFSENRSAVFVVDPDMDMPGKAVVVGTEGSLELGRKFYNGTDLSLIKNGRVVKTFNFPAPEPKVDTPTKVEVEEEEVVAKNKPKVDPVVGGIVALVIEARKNLKKKNSSVDEEMLKEAETAIGVCEEIAKMVGEKVVEEE